MVEAPLLQDSEFETLAKDFSGNALSSLEDLWNNCIDKSDEDIQQIIKAFRTQADKWSNRLIMARIENGNLVSDKIMNGQKKYGVKEFGSEQVEKYDKKTHKVTYVTMYYLKAGIGRKDVDQMTVNQFNQLRKEFTKEQQEFLICSEKYRNAQKELDLLRKDPLAYTDEQFSKIRSNAMDTEKAYNTGLEKIGLKRDAFDSKGEDVKAYVKGLQQLKKSDISKYSAKVQTLRAQINICVAVLNKKRGNKAIETVRKAGNINTGIIDSEVETLVTLPKENIWNDTPGDSLPEIPNHA